MLWCGIYSDLHAVTTTSTQMCAVVLDHARVHAHIPWVKNLPDSVQAMCRPAGDHLPFCVQLRDAEKLFNQELSAQATDLRVVCVNSFGWFFKPYKITKPKASTGTLKVETKLGSSGLDLLSPSSTSSSQAGAAASGRTSTTTKRARPSKARTPLKKILPSGAQSSKRERESDSDSDNAPIIRARPRIVTTPVQPAAAVPPEASSLNVSSAVVDVPVVKKSKPNPDDEAQAMMTESDSD